MTSQPTQIDNKVYDYTKDNIKYCDEKKEYKIVYQCQKSKKKYDNVLKDSNVILKFFYRKRKQTPFEYIGMVQNRKVLEERSKGTDRLTMQFVIPKQESLTIPEPTTKGQGKYKIPIFKVLNVEPKSKCYMHGIMEVIHITE
jgi:hypothetical protein